MTGMEEHFEQTFSDLFGIDVRLNGGRTRKSGRPLAAQTIVIRNAILELPSEQAQMTVRGIFYALTVRGVVDKTEAGYRQVQRQVLQLRRDDQLDWGFVADGTRWVSQPETWNSVDDVLQETARTYRRNLWRSQGVRIEIWLEKDALAALVRDVTYRWGVRLMVSRGQSSDTFCYSAAQDVRAAWEGAGVETIVYTLFDSDKSGRIAAAKVEEKLRRYSGNAPIHVTNLAVTDEQIRVFNLPTRPAKEEGEPDAVELDAFPPNQLMDLVDDAIGSHVDLNAWAREKQVEQSERAILTRMAEDSA